MKVIIFEGPIRADVTNLKTVLYCIFELEKFLEINGESKEARAYLDTLEELEERVMAGVFKK